jgi:hypothetical protein
MTDLLEQREVTTSPIEAALRVPFDPSMCTKVARFGFEYEMLPVDYDRDDDYDDDIYVDSDEVWSDDHSTCNCEECIDERRDARADEIRRERAERRAENDGDADKLVARALNAGLITDGYMHSYHCRCSICSPTRVGALMTAQTDCSCGVEFISHILDLNRADWDAKRDQINQWVDMMKGWARDGNWMPDGDVSNGNHVHVSNSGRDGGGDGFNVVQMDRARRHVNALYAVYDWSAVADGGCGNIRSYNAKPHKDNGGGSWLSDRGYGTMEHRLWNTPADPQRLWAHLGISIALTRWAFALAHADPAFDFWTTVDRWGSPKMTDEMFAGLNDNLDRVIAAVKAYIPDGTEFDLAREVLGNLAPL